MTLRLGIIGLGHWGPNYLRIFSGIESATVVACAEADATKHARFKHLYSSVRFVTDANAVIADPEIDAVIIATPTATHFKLTQSALEHKKHVLVEKPLTPTSAEAQQLVAIADREKRILMVGHTFLYNTAVQAVKKMIQAGELGHLHYFSAVRTNLGPIRQDVNALVDLAPHDISTLLYWLDQMPETVSATGACYLNPKVEDIAFVTLRFPNSVLAQVHVSWLEPVKVRRTTVIGDRKMAVFNDIDAMEPLRVFDKGVTLAPKSYTNFQEFQMIIREGDVVIPKIAPAEPLQAQCRDFLSAVDQRKAPVSDGVFGVRVVQVLEAALHSMRSGGQPVDLQSLRS